MMETDILDLLVYMVVWGWQGEMLSSDGNRHSCSFLEVASRPDGVMGEEHCVERQ